MPRGLRSLTDAVVDLHEADELPVCASSRKLELLRISARLSDGAGVLLALVCQDRIGVERPLDHLLDLRGEGRFVDLLGAEATALALRVLVVLRNLAAKLETLRADQLPKLFEARV